MKLNIILFLICSVLLFVLFQQILKQKINYLFAGMSEGKITVILTGFGSKDANGNWTGEIAPFVNKLEQSKNISSEIVMCENSLEGYIYGNKVIVASTGMAKVKTTACLLNILQNYKGKVSEVIFVGIAGITPMKGGVLDESGKIRVSDPAMLGDICINDLAFDFDLQHYTSDQAISTSPNPLFWSQDSIFPSQFTKGNSELSQELNLASLKIVWPDSSQNVKDINIRYHGFTRKPKVWNSNECLEATSDLYWHDIKLDLKAREIAAKYLNQVRGSSVTAEDVLVVTSMEALPVGAVVNWWNQQNNTDIEFAYVRGASNFDHTYLNSDGIPLKNGKESMEQFGNSDSSEYAIQNAALTVLKMLELRKLKN